ncbi:MAG: leucine-rich repeat domain-containing protein [Ferruginibacter sp.]
MNTILNHLDWWKQLEPQWQEAFGVCVLRHLNEPDAAELDMLFNLEAIRMAGPTAPFPNMQFELTNLSGMVCLSSLRIIIVTHHKIESIEAVSNLPLLRSLFLFNNSITRLAGIEALTELQQLYVQCNRISSIKPVELLTKLREFYISDNCIASLEGLTEKHSDELNVFVCRPNEQLKQKEIIRVERDLGIICRGS